MGYPKWQLVLCLLAVYLMLYVSLFKGVKSSGILHKSFVGFLVEWNGGFAGKVVWVTSTMPYVVLSILLVRGLMLPGAMKGIMYYLQPELSKLKETQVRFQLKPPQVTKWQQPLIPPPFFFREILLLLFPFH